MFILKDGFPSFNLLNVNIGGISKVDETLNYEDAEVVYGRNEVESSCGHVVPWVAEGCVIYLLETNGDILHEGCHLNRFVFFHVSTIQVGVRFSKVYAQIANNIQASEYTIQMTWTAYQWQNVQQLITGSQQSHRQSAN